MVNKFPGSPFSSLDVFPVRQGAVTIQVPVQFFSLGSEIEFEFFICRIPRDDIRMHRSGHCGKQDNQDINYYEAV